MFFHYRMVDELNNLYEFYAKGMEDIKKLKPWGKWGHFFYIQCTEEIAEKLLLHLSSITQHCKKPQDLDKKTWIKVKRTVRIASRSVIYPIPFKVLKKELGMEIANWLITEEYTKTVENRLLPNELKQWYKYWEVKTFERLSNLNKKIVYSEFKNPQDLKHRICEIAEELENLNR